MTKPSALRRIATKAPLWALLLAAVASLWTLGAEAQTFSKREPTLRERLTLGLQARRPVELDYIDAVIDTVNRGELPEKVVNRMFFWARGHAPRGDQSMRPIIYFQAGLNQVAEKMHIRIRSDEEPAVPPVAT